MRGRPFPVERKIMSATTTAASLSVLRDLSLATEPSASVYVGLHPADPVADAGADLGLRWRRLATELAEQGADRATLAAIGDDLAEQPASPAYYAIVASSGSVVFRQTLPNATGADHAHFGAPADVLPLIAFVQDHPAYVKVVTDRTGADVTTVARGAASGPTTLVFGTDDEIERNAPGGWAQARYQRRAEDSWQHNAGEVARQVAQAVREVDAHLLLVSGDVRAVQLLRDHLPNAVRNTVSVRQLSGGRRPDGSAPLQDVAAAQAVSERAAAETIELMDRLDNERRVGGLAVEGATATLAALAQGRVDTLIIVDDPADERVAWFGPSNAGALKRTEPMDRIGRLVDVAIRAAVLSDADVRVVSPELSRGLRQGIGALCRFRYNQPSVTPSKVDNKPRAKRRTYIG